MESEISNAIMETKFFTFDYQIFSATVLQFLTKRIMLQPLFWLKEWIGQKQKLKNQRWNKKNESKIRNSGKRCQKWQLRFFYVSKTNEWTDRIEFVNNYL